METQTQKIPKIEGTWPIIVNLRRTDYSEVLYIDKSGELLCLNLCPHRGECKKKPLCLEEEEVEEFLVPERPDGKTKLRKFNSWEEAFAYAVKMVSGTT
jgi:hypothetical protein